MIKRDPQPSGNSKPRPGAGCSRWGAVLRRRRGAEVRPAELERFDAWLGSHRVTEPTEARLRRLEHAILAATERETLASVNMDVLWKSALVLATTGLIAGIVIGYLISMQKMGRQSETVASLGATSFMTGGQNGQ